MTKTKKRAEFPKHKPTIFPLGFSAATIEDGSIVLIEFLDTIDGVRTIIESIALPRSKALQLSKALKSAFEDNDESAEKEA